MLKKSKLLKIAGVIFVGAFSLGFLTGAVTEISLSKNYKVVSETYVVREGDTLTDICLAYRKLDARDPYILEFMDEVRENNAWLKQAKNQLMPGDKLQINYKVER